MLFGQLLPPLAKSRQVIAVELQAHGHTADIDRPLRYELMADDIVALTSHLGLAHAVELFGLLGGGKRDGDALGLPPSQLAVLAGTTHSSVLFRTALLLPTTIVPFLDNGLSPSDSEVLKD